MNYFITTAQTPLTSSIELAQVRRLKIFDSLKQPATIVDLCYNFDHRQIERQLGITGRVLNIYQYFQRLPYQFLDGQASHDLADRILHQDGYVVHDDEQAAYLDGQKRVQAFYRDENLYYIDYNNQEEKLVRRDFYDCGCRTYSEFVDEHGQMTMRQYYDYQGRPKITYYYHGVFKNKPVLKMIHLRDRDQLHTFETEDQFRAYFLDQLVEHDPGASFISDRSDVTLNAFLQMRYRIARYQVFHSTFTMDGRPDGQLFPIYDQIKGMLAGQYLTGLISSTDREAQDAKKRFQTAKSYGIPVTYMPTALLNKRIPFSQRKRGQIIAVARLTTVKRLDDLINTVVLLHQRFSFVDLKIYGFGDGNYATTNYLHRLVKQNQAQDYIHFCGFTRDLTSVYETAEIEVLTSFYEGFAMALLEAAGHACPTVSYDINYGPAEIIQNGVNGCLVPNGDSHGLYVTLANLLEDQPKLQEFSAHAQAVVTKYSFTNVKAKWQQFLQQEGLWQ